jgi:hypothetical protein
MAFGYSPFTKDTLAKPAHSNAAWMGRLALRELQIGGTRPRGFEIRTGLHPSSFKSFLQGSEAC